MTMETYGNPHMPRGMIVVEPRAEVGDVVFLGREVLGGYIVRPVRKRGSKRGASMDGLKAPAHGGGFTTKTGC